MFLLQSDFRIITSLAAAVPLNRPSSKRGFSSYSISAFPAIPAIFPISFNQCSAFPGLRVSVPRAKIPDPYSSAAGFASSRSRAMPGLLAVDKNRNPGVSEHLHSFTAQHNR
jgi:hypothetical protein